MKTFKNMAAQGDLLIRRIDRLPEHLPREMQTENSEYVVAHSETGHHHVIEATADVTAYQDPEDVWKAFLEVRAEQVELRHKRGHDTHETIAIPKGVYELRRQREYTPEGFRRAAD